MQSHPLFFFAADPPALREQPRHAPGESHREGAQGLLQGDAARHDRGPGRLLRSRGTDLGRAMHVFFFCRRPDPPGPDFLPPCWGVYFHRCCWRRVIICTFLFTTLGATSEQDARYDSGIYDWLLVCSSAEELPGIYLATILSQNVSTVLIEY